MIINSRSANYTFTFPKNFYSKTVLNKWEKWVKRLPLPYDTVEAFMASTIQSVSFPGITMEPVQQTRTLGKKQEFRNSTPIADLWNRELTIDFKTVDGYANWWIFLENILDNHLNFSASPSANYLEDPLAMRFLSQEGHVIQTIQFKGVYFKSIGDLVMSYSDNNPEYKNFTVVLGFYKLDLVIDHD